MRDLLRGRYAVATIAPSWPTSLRHTTSIQQTEETPFVQESVSPVRVHNLHPVSTQTPASPATPSDIMDILVEKYTRFSTLAARGKVELTDIMAIRAVCNQVDASAVSLEAEARSRRHLAQYIRSCVDLLKAE